MSCHRLKGFFHLLFSFLNAKLLSTIWKSSEEIESFGKAPQPFSVWTLIPATPCHNQQHPGCLLQSAAGQESWLSLGTYLMRMASKTKGRTFQAVARRCGYLTKLRLPFLYSLLANPFRAAASLTLPQRAKCSRQHRELYPADTSIFTRLFQSPPGDVGSTGGSSSFSLASLGFSATKILDFFLFLRFLTDSCPTRGLVTSLQNTRLSWLISITFTCTNTEQMGAVDIFK